MIRIRNILISMEFRSKLLNEQKDKKINLLMIFHARSYPQIHLRESCLIVVLTVIVHNVDCSEYKETQLIDS
jgi:hypothetical protein